MIIGIAGSYGAGKGAVVDYLKGRGFRHYSASGFITEEVEKRGLPINRDSMIAVANDLRAEHGPSFIIDSLYKRAEEFGGDAIIESLRAVAEAKRIKELGGIVLGVDAEPKLRYERSVSRGSAKDNVTYEKWQEQEKSESNNDDPTKQNIWQTLDEADYRIENNGSLEDLYDTLDDVMGEIGV